MGQAKAAPERLIGREAEMRQLRAAMLQRKSQLICGPADSGKTFFVATALAALSGAEQRNCIGWSGAGSRRQIIGRLIQALYLAGDPFVSRKVQADGFTHATLPRWIDEQSSLRLRGILFTAAESGQYLFFFDHLPSESHSTARLLKELMYRTKSPVFLTGYGCSRSELGDAWSLYWNDDYRIRLGPLSEAKARELLERCIRDFGIGSLDLSGFREEVLRLSGLLPGGIVKMCRLAANPRYQYGDQVKIKLIHVDYLLEGNRVAANLSPSL